MSTDNATLETPTYSTFRPGAAWNDTDGRPIQAHGGGVLYHQGVYYWYGENKDVPNMPGSERVEVVGVSCYSSRDLLNWKHEGVVLPAVKDDPESDLHPLKVVERPKVIHNVRTGKFVMWMHIDDSNYQYARAGVAVADRPEGPFTYLGSVRPCDADSRDLTVFQDDDGAAYLVTGVLWHSAIQIVRLSDDYLRPDGEFVRVLQRPGPPTGRESPAIFKRRGRYYLVSSGTTGWNPNAAEYAVADRMLGEWTTQGNPCTGPDAELTFHAQNTHVLPVAGGDDAFIVMFDRWNPHNLRDSRYVWLPAEFSDAGDLCIPWREEWRLEASNMVETCTQPARASTHRVRAYIAASWDKTVRTSPDDPSHVRVPYPYTVPSIEGTFQELYYWDTYFTDRGLLLDGRTELARQNCDNMLYLVDTYGFMPNGTRTFYLTRSQSPYLLMMALDVFRQTDDRTWLRRAYPTLKREYETWTTGSHRAGETGLSRYFDRETDRQKLLSAFGNVAGRIGLPTDISDDKKVLQARHALAECAGWDFTPRFENRCLDFIPVDLNANLYLYELDFATIAETLGDGTATEWREKAAARRERLEHFCWSETRGLYLDYDFVNQRHSTVASLATFQPLWAGLADAARAARVRENLPLFERDFGLATCEPVETGSRSYQWGYPNGWAPLHLIAVEGLRHYGYESDAARIAGKYLEAITGLFDQTGKLWEKYNVCDGTLNTASEYGTPEMLGWTAGVFCVFADGCHELAPGNGDQV